ncbi:hypothetical protein [Amycolatopsis taiwanensis]|uniref:hypothetical protein n=1 Tax=Amycolatopsis taiwanensis TaxID=342230 RepID=UPI0004857613|nr:hypothetical protein [Amycolatopsis taiwanensis]
MPEQDITERLVDGGMRAIDETGFSTTLEERRAYAQAVAVSVLETIAEEIDDADEEGSDWPDGDDLRLLASEIRGAEPKASRA